MRATTAAATSSAHGSGAAAARQVPLASCTAATASAAASTHASSDQVRGGVGRVGPAVATATPTLAGTWRVSTGSMPAGTCSTVRPATPQNASRPEPPGRHTGLAGSG